MSQYPARVRIELSVEELQANIQFLSDQIFRVKFIDPKIPGNQSNVSQVRAAESALLLLQEALKARSGPKPTRINEVQLPKRIDEPDFQKPVRATRSRSA
jgi:hypothetical protein